MLCHPKLSLLSLAPGLGPRGPRGFVSLSFFAPSIFWTSKIVHHNGRLMLTRRPSEARAGNAPSGLAGVRGSRSDYRGLDWLSSAADCTRVRRILQHGYAPRGDAGGEEAGMGCPRIVPPPLAAPAPSAGSRETGGPVPCGIDPIQCSSAQVGINKTILK